MTIPIITLNWNGIQDTIECMESLSKQTYTDYIIYLVDNGSDENNVAELKERYTKHPKIQLIFNKKNLGFTKGNNEILKQILLEDYSYVVLLNNDTAQEATWLEELVKSVQENQADMVTSKMINYFDRKVMDNAGHLMLNTAEVIPLASNEPINDWNEVTDNIGACAGAAIYSTAMLQEMGIFDEYFETGYEDAELGLRANVLGYKTIFEPKAVVYHKVQQSVKKIMNYEYILKIQLNIFYTYFKLLPLGVLLLNLPFLVFKYLAVIIIDIVFWRPKFLKMMLDALKHAFFIERKKIVAARRLFHQKHKTVSSWSILKKMTFFLWFDIKRFWKYVILAKKTEFEQY